MGGVAGKFTGVSPLQPIGTRAVGPLHQTIRDQCVGLALLPSCSVLTDINSA